MLQRLLGLTLALSVAGCGVNSAIKSTEELRDNSRDLKINSGQLAKRTDDLEHEATFDRSAFNIVQNLRWLFGIEEAVGKAWTYPNGEPDYMGHAGFTIESFWFQFWKGDYREDMNDLDVRFEVSSRLFLTFLKTHVPYSQRVDTMLINRSWKGAAALGASLDYVNARFAEALQRANIPQFSYYDVIMAALKPEGTDRLQAMLPKTMHRIRVYKQEAEYLIQLRHNFLPLMVVSFLTDFKDRWLIGRALMYLKDNSRVGQTLKWIMGPERFDVERFHTDQFAEWTEWLNKARATREDLRTKVGVAPKYNRVLLGVASNVDFDQEKWVALLRADDGHGEVATLSKRDRALATFAVAYQNHVSEANAELALRDEQKRMLKELRAPKP